MALFRYPITPWAASNEPFAHRGRKRLRPVVRLKVVGPSGILGVHTYLDTGSEFCLFPEWVAWRVGLRKQPQSAMMPVGSSVSGTGFVAWFDTVQLQIDDPANVQAPFRWSAAVGFTPAGSFATSPIAGLLGVNGGLDRFQRVEFDWSALGGPEVVVRV